MKRKTAADFPQELLDLYDHYAHGLIDRRSFLNQAGKYAAGGITAVALLKMLSPNYVHAQQVPLSDERVVSQYVEYPSPEGHGTMKGLLARPAGITEKLPGVLVVHENRGLNPYIEDVARRVALAGFVAFAPDALTPLGGYPGSDEEGKAMQRQLDGGKMAEDFVAATHFLHEHPECNGQVGVVGFCFGGAVSNALAVSLPEIIKAAVPYYGRQPAAADVAKIKGSLLIHYGELDKRVNEGWPDYQKALDANKIDYTVHFYPEANHGFHNDTTPRYDEAAAKLSWQRTIAFFIEKLNG
ncbi:MAG: dienelactone hydrolase family protein [Opitutales bacterium]|jgi:carboxymethylenebutenolidase|nr:dienelactone hydrolase family protein [Opitutales bacterium]MDP4644741.1 dienelactone hydrolase family protein [Opitutales bacterium]MDP4777438.1 dienelactone hydrolase family protein [Opitutales bacterium]MDP4882957.1 dienelactone hydrolase family protein [Opitutales bacterium]MDP5080375.1 dienelactone hydrolase family protein [Opitutales bacterium]